jgi:hypothetical protein
MRLMTMVSASLLCAAAASAHTIADPGEAPAGQSQRVAFQ